MLGMDAIGLAMKPHCVTRRGWISRIARTCAPALGFALGAGACEQGPEPPDQAGPKPPDVILITLDTTRADRLGVYGYTKSTSPNIDAFAREAVVFRRAFSTSPWTLPSHASMFTGKYPTRHGAHHNATDGDSNLGELLEGEAYRELKVDRLAESEVTLAELLAEKGYATGAFVGGPWLTPPFGLLQGFEARDAAVDTLVGRSAEELTDAAIAWMQRVPARKPLHLLLNYFDPHNPYEPPDPFRPEEPADLQQLYDGEIRFMDHHLGRLLDALRAAGRYDTALVILVADHGELLGEHGIVGHGPWLYEELIRIPLLIRFPDGREGGTTSDSVVSVVDLLPVVAAETGISLPPGIDGLPLGQRRRALAESYRDVTAVKALGMRFDRDLTALIDWPWKLVASSKGKRRLHRLDDDPGEATNLAQDELQQERLEELLAQLSAERAKLVPGESVAPRDLDPTVVERLRSLGYVE